MVFVRHTSAYNRHNFKGYFAFWVCVFGLKGLAIMYFSPPLITLWALLSWPLVYVAHVSSHCSVLWQLFFFLVFLFWEQRTYPNTVFPHVHVGTCTINTIKCASRLMQSFKIQTAIPISIAISLARILTHFGGLR